MCLNGRRVLWEDMLVHDRQQQLAFDGIPFVVLGAIVLDCAHGVNRHLSQKNKATDLKITQKVCEYAFLLHFLLIRFVFAG